MRILHVNLAAGWRGGEQQTLLLMQGLRSVGVESQLVARRNSELARLAVAAGFEVVGAAPCSLGTVRRSSRFDVIHAHETKGLQLVAFALIFTRRRFIVTRRVDFTPGRNTFTRWKYRRAAKVVAVSNFVSNVMGEWGVSASQRDIVYDAVAKPESVDETRVASLRERFAGRRVVGCVAALVISHKDQVTLLRAIDLVNRERDDVEVVLLGEGQDREQLEVLAVELGLQNVSFDGFVGDVWPYYEVMDVFVLTSRVEGLGSSVLEAFAACVPVVATDAGGIPELVRHGQTGWLAPVGDHEAVASGILRMLDDAGFARQCSEGATAMMRERHTAEVMARAYVRIYESVLEGDDS